MSSTRQPGADLLNGTGEKESCGGLSTKADDGDNTATSGGPQFLSLRSRIGKKYQATLPPLNEGKACALDYSSGKSRFCLNRAKDLGNELNDYLNFARSLRDGVTHDTEEQIKFMALNHLHKFDYNTVDAACSLYAKHSIDGIQVSSHCDPKSPNYGEMQWTMRFFHILRQPYITKSEYDLLIKLNEQSFLVEGNVELQVLNRLLCRLKSWLEKYSRFRTQNVDRTDICMLINEAEDLSFVVSEKIELEKRVIRFDKAFGSLKEALDRSTRRNQPKLALKTLESLYNSVLDTKINFPDEENVSQVVFEAQKLKQGVSTMLKEEKLSLHTMKEVIGRMEQSPVNFEDDVQLFQEKMLSAQSWLAKVRKCIPNRRATRRTGSDAKKADLDEIRALIVDAPCEDSAEMFEIQDLLKCADEWAKKVKNAIESGTESTLDELKELMEEGNEMPVEMEEQQFLGAEINAREWVEAATEALVKRESLVKLEEMAENAKKIRKTLHPRKQNKWRPQVERDISAAIEQARRWVIEARDLMGGMYFDRMFPDNCKFINAKKVANVSVAPTSQLASAKSDLSSKQTIQAYTSLVAKAESIPVNIDSFVEPIQELLNSVLDLQRRSRTLLQTIGFYPNIPSSDGCVRESPGKDGSAPEPEPTQQKLSPDAKINRGDPSPSTSAREMSSDASDFAVACALLDKIDALPVAFQEGMHLRQIVTHEREWVAKVRDALPPRQSRKKRHTSQRVTLIELEHLLAQSKALYFAFNEEKEMLQNEIDELRTWQKKARYLVLHKIEEICEAVRKLMNLDSKTHKELSEALVEDLGTVSAVPDGDQGSNIGKNEALGQVSPKDHDANNISEPTQLKEKPEKAKLSGSKGTTDEEHSDVASLLPEISPSSPQINVDLIVKHLRIASGCAGKSTKKIDEKEDSKEDCRTSLLNELLLLVEKDLAQVILLETHEFSEGDDTTTSIPVSQDKNSVRQQGQVSEDHEAQMTGELKRWGEEISRFLDETLLLNAFIEEQGYLTTIQQLLEWLFAARRIFYHEVVSIKELVSKGADLKTELQIIEAKKAFSNEVTDGLYMCLYPLQQLQHRLSDVEEWSRSVAELLHPDVAVARDGIYNSKATFAEIKHIINRGRKLLLEPDSYRCVEEEIKKAKSWLAKLRKRLKSLLTKKITRMPIQAARNLFEEGQAAVRLQLDSFIMLQKEVNQASAWENRVLASGIESGQARIADLLELLEEYEACPWLVDMEMHRTVLLSATERYCICRQPFDGLMIGCDHCDDWFHDTCIGMSKEKAEKVENYTCPSCHLILQLVIKLKQQGSAGANYVSPNIMMSVGCVSNGDESSTAYERQHATALRKLQREQKAKNRSETQLVNNQISLDKLSKRIGALKNGTQDHQSFQNNGVAHSEDPKSSATQYPAVILSATTYSEAELVGKQYSIAHSNSTPIMTHTNQEGVVKNEGVTHAAAGMLSMLSEPPAMILPGVPEPERSQDIRAIAHAMPKLIRPAVMIGASSPYGKHPQVESGMQLATSIPSMGSGASIEERLSQLHQEYAELLAQKAELEHSLKLSSERYKIAQSSLADIEAHHQKRQTLLPLAKRWIRKATDTINAFSNLYQAKSKINAIENDMIVVPEYQECITEAETHGLDALEEVTKMMQLLRAICWTLFVVSLLQKRPSREQLVRAILYAHEKGLLDAKALLPLRSVVSRTDIWIGKAQKCILKTSGSTSNKLSRLKLLVNEYSKLPLTCAFSFALERYVQALETVNDESEIESLAQETIQAADDALKANTFSSATSSAIAGAAGKKRKSYTKREKSSAASNGKRPKSIVDSDHRNAPPAPSAVTDQDP